MKFIEKLLKSKILVEQGPSEDEINDLLQIVKRDLKDSKASDVSYDWQFGIAYNAALKLATILVRLEGYRVRGQRHHLNTILLIPELLGEEGVEYRDYLDACRKKRNIVEYDCIGGATKEDVMELQEFVVEFKNLVVQRIESN